MSQGVISLIWFAAILALIPLALWLLRRTPMGGAAGGGVLRSVAALPLSTNQRIVTIEVGDGAERRWLVLGITPHSITTLHTMAPQADPAGAAPAAPALPGFARMLATLRPDKERGLDR
jgi:flagellar protein FliO/FliZ